MIGMSATIGNLEEIANFLNAELYVRNFRPVGLKEYVKCENEIWLIDYKEEEMFKDKKIVNFQVKYFFFFNFPTVTIIFCNFNNYIFCLKFLVL